MNQLSKGALALALVLQATIISISPVANAVVSPAISIDPGNLSSYSGSGTSVSSIGTTSTTGTMTSVTYSSGNGGKFTFNGSGSSIAFPSFDFTSTFTITAWVKPLTTSNINTVVSNTTANTYSNGFKVEWNNWISNDQKLLTETGNGSSGMVAASDAAAVTYGSWQMLTWVVNKTAGKTYMYRNGMLQTTTTNDIRNDFNTSGSWWLGSMYGSYYWMKADLGTLKVWKSNLTQSEIQTDYDSTNSRYADPLVPTISTQPNSVTVNTGQTATFSGSASTSDGGTLSYQWQISTDNGSSWSNVSGGAGATSTSYTTAATNRSWDGYLYRLVATNTLNGSTSTANSNSASLVVNKVTPTVTSSLSASSPNYATYRTTTSITATTGVAGKMSFKAGNSWIPSCRSLSISSSVTCTFKPSKTGSVAISIFFAPTSTADYNNSSSAPVTLLVSKRTGRR